MKNKFTAKKIFLLALIFSVCVIVMYSLLFVTIIRKNTALASLAENVKSQMAEKNTLTSLKEKVEATEASREKIKNYFIQKDAVVPFLNSIQALGEDNGLDLKIGDVTLEDAPMWEDVFESVKMKIEVVGDWSDVRRFVSLIDLLPFKVIIDQVNLEKVVAEGSSNGGKKVALADLGWKGIMEIRVLKFK